ncbi:hypothetical protein PybrP1_000474 [[Pythium] brassicae (nom. inval.)]|nr:hypothetical protein PybrP1_000474 [[Pythium] brassicae (nom. inval.)]
MPPMFTAQAMLRCCAWLALLCASLTTAEFNESLTLRALPGGRKVLSHFRFASREAGEDGGAGEFPKVLRQILSKYEAEALHLTFALGRHSDARYGSVIGSGSHAPFGTRLQVWLRDAVGNAESLAESVELLERWRGITAELGGVFSASLNQMDHTVVTDVISVDADPSVLGALPLSTSMSSRFLLAGLAREEICTENLTPWLKMLPCRSHAGLGKLIDPIKYLSGEYLSLSLFASRASGDWELQQQLVSVQTLGVEERERWSLKSIFFNSIPEGQAILEACPLASESVIYTEVPAEGFELQHSPETTLVAEGDPASFGAPVLHATSLKHKQLDITDPWLARTDAPSPAAPLRDLVNVHRFMTGYGQVHGGIAVRLENNHPQCVMRVTYHEVVPWFLRMYYNTFQAKVIEGGSDAKDASSLVQDLRFVPAEVRGRPNQLYLELVLPANSSLVFSIQLEKAFLRLSEHPPDANRGFDVPSGVATFEPIAGDQHERLCGELRLDPRAFTRTLFTEPLLVPLPTPDFSMPYNVITMTSTVVAFFVGSLLNTLLRKAPRIKQMMTAQ